jgi:ABC-type polysaccharide/polyol phosphate transport system ATPase subunit
MDESGERASALMRLMTGLVLPDAGTARRRGGGLLLTPPNRRWVASLSVRQAVRLLGGLYGMTDAQIDQGWPQWVEFAEVGDILGKPVEEVDAAVLRQVAFAVGTAAPVRLLGLEHMALAGPPEFRTKCIPRLRQLTQSGTSLVVVQDKPDLIALLADRALLVKRNKLVELTPDEAADLAREWVAHRRRARKKSKRAMFEDDDDDDII